MILVKSSSFLTEKIFLRIYEVVFGSLGALKDDLNTDIP